MPAWLDAIVNIPWPGALAVASMAVRGVLRDWWCHRENSQALAKAEPNQIAEVMRSITGRRKFWRPPDRRPPP